MKELILHQVTGVSVIDNKRPPVAHGSDDYSCVEIAIVTEDGSLKVVLYGDINLGQDIASAVASRKVDDNR